MTYSRRAAALAQPRRARSPRVLRSRRPARHDPVAATTSSGSGAPTSAPAARSASSQPAGAPSSATLRPGEDKSRRASANPDRHGRSRRQRDVGSFHVSSPSFSVVIAAYQAAEGWSATAVRVRGRAGTATPRGDRRRRRLDRRPGTSQLAGFGGAPSAVIRIEHGGEAAAKNAGCGSSNRGFIAFLDADDRFLPGRLAALSTLAISRPGLDVLTTDAYLAARRGRSSAAATARGTASRARINGTAILQRNFVLGLSAVRRSPFHSRSEGSTPTVEYTTDWELWMRLILSGSEVGFIDEPLAEYRLHAGSMSARRAAMSRGRLASLARAEARTDLTVAERAHSTPRRKSTPRRFACSEKS